MTQYYIQDTRFFVGNAVMWWRPKGAGYTCDIEDAGIYSEEKALLIAANRDTDVPWPVEDVRPLIKGYVDMQQLRRVKKRT